MLSVAKVLTDWRSAIVWCWYGMALSYEMIIPSTIQPFTVIMCEVTKAILAYRVHLSKPQFWSGQALSECNGKTTRWTIHQTSFGVFPTLLPWNFTTIRFWRMFGRLVSRGWLGTGVWRPTILIWYTNGAANLLAIHLNLLLNLWLGASRAHGDSRWWRCIDLVG